MDSFNTFLSIIYCDGRHGPCWDITGQKRMTNVYSGMILKSWESHLDGDGLKSGQEMMRLFFSFQIWIVYEMLLHQTFLLFNLAELSSFPWLFFSKGWGLIASLEHIRPQPLQTWCLIWSKIILIINLDSPLWLCIGSNQINRIHESSLMWICNTSTYLLQLVHLCCCNSKWWARWLN